MILIKKYILFKLFTLLFFLFLSNTSIISQLYINEILTKNTNSLIDKDFYNFGDWIELYNNNTSSIDLSGYKITDDVLTQNKWSIPNGTIIPAKGYILIWADTENQFLHTNFKLNGDSGYVAIYNSSLNLLDEVYYPKQFTNTSYGRFPNATNEWEYFAHPTPYKANLTQGTLGIVADSVIFSLPGGFYNIGSFSIILLSSVSAEIYYTIDGSIPSEKSLKYSSPIDINNTTIIRAIAYETGKIPSDITSQTYLINVHQSSLPIICINTNPEYLWDDSIGIYVEGVNGIDGRGMSYPVNWNQDWERPIHIEYFDSEKNTGFSCQAGLAIFGGWSRRNAQKSFSITFRNDYGRKEINYPLFKDFENTKFKSFILRNSGNDFNNTQFRDAVLQKLLYGQMDIDMQAYEPAVIYLNGQYWGIQNIREKLNKYYIEEHYNINSDSVDIIDLDGGYSVKAGSMDHYNSMIAYLQNHDITQQAHYDYIKTQMDVEEFMNYNIVEIFYRNHDWPVKNDKWWHPQTTDGKWRWMLFDLDITTGIWGQDPTTNSIEYALSPFQTGANPDYSTYLLRRLMENEEFKDEFIRRFLLYINTTFNPNRVASFIDDAAKNIQAEMPYHCSRWGGGVGSWNNRLSQMKDWCAIRPGEVMQHIGNYFNLGNSTSLSLSRNINKAGVFDFIGERIRDSIFNTYVLSGYQYKIKALNNLGYNFNHWEVNTINVDTFSVISKESSWKYLDNGNNPSSTWKDLSFNDNLWQTGNEEFGYGEGNENTVINYGSDANNKYRTYYFRKKFICPDTISFTNMYIHLLRDDGAVVYLNGNEIIRSNMPIGTIYDTTLASSTIDGSDETRYFTFNLDTNFLNADTNIIAVEIHQASPTSSDISYDLEIIGVWQSSLDNYTLYNSEINLNFQGNTILQAVYSIDTTNTSHLFINEVLTNNINGGYPDEYGETDDWIEIYNSGDLPIDLSLNYLSDNILNPYKWQLPTDTNNTLIIKPKGFILLWADGEPQQGSKHLGFKLSSKGEFISLYIDNNEKLGYLDSLSYDSLLAFNSFGRYKDGSNNIYKFSIATPGSENILDYNNTEDNLLTNINIYPNPAHNKIYISNSILFQQIDLLDVYGRIIVSKQINADNKFSINVSSLSTGIYFCRLTTIKDNYIVKKIIIQ